MALSRKLRTFIASSPNYEVYKGCYYGDNPEPPEYGCDVCLVEAYTKREAKIIALKHFLKQTNNYYIDCCIGDHVPYKHINLEEIDVVAEIMESSKYQEDFYRSWYSDYVPYKEKE